MASPSINVIYDLCGSYMPALIGCSLVMLFVLITMYFVIVKAYKVREKVIAECENEIPVKEVTG